ncbi:MAG: hypothetical protein ACKOGH_01050 [Alphaproteobacteria bacterium]
MATAHGLLEARQSVDDDECGPDEMHPCAVIVLDGKVLFADRIALVEEVLPSRDDPRLVAVAVHDGGNCCPGTDILLDFTGPRLLVVEGFGLRDAEAKADGSFVLKRYEQDNEMGDPIMGVYAYAPGSGVPRLLRRSIEFPPVELGEWSYPHAILGDPDLRRPLVEAIGAQRFAAFRHDMGVQGPISILSPRYLAGSGCRPHSCPVAAGMFVIDREEGTAIVLHMDEDRDRHVRYWGRLDDAGPLQRAAIGEWLAHTGHGWRQLIPSPD